MMLNQRAHDVDVRIAMRDHDALGSSRCSAGVVNRNEIRLTDFDRFKLRVMGGQGLLVVQPPIAGSFERNKHFHCWNLTPDCVNGLEMIGVCTDRSSPAMVNDVCKVFRFQPKVNWDQHSTYLRHCIVGL